MVSSSVVHNLRDLTYCYLEQVLVSAVHVQVRLGHSLIAIGQRVDKGERRTRPRGEQQQYIHPLQEPNLTYRNAYIYSSNYTGTTGYDDTGHFR